MHRLVTALLAAVLLTSCAPGRLAELPQNLALAAREKVKNTLAARFIKELGGGVGTVVSALARPGGYLDNPLVRVLLPPPVGLVLDVAREMNANPQASPLVVLMNRAAEQAIPGAAPILQAALSQVTPAEARLLLDGGKTAGTEYLKAKTAETLRDALAPSVSTLLAASGANRTYGELVEAYQAQKVLGAPGEGAAMEEPVRDLGQYVAGQAVEGFFKTLGARETLIRENLDAMAGGVFQGMTGGQGETAPAVEPPAVEPPAEDGAPLPLSR